MGEVEGTNADYTLSHSGNCMEIYESFLQPVGRPTIESTASDGALLDQIVGSSSDFVAYLDDTDTSTAATCYYVYTGQYATHSLGGLPVIRYNTATGLLDTIAEI
jgi:hypothetical protein